MNDHLKTILGVSGSAGFPISAVVVTKFAIDILPLVQIGGILAGVVFGYLTYRATKRK